jgi:hypothetical protein
MTHQNVISPDDDARQIRIDAEHFAVRFLVPVLVVSMTIVGHFVGIVVIDDIVGHGINPVCVMLPLDVLVMIGGGFLIERLLKRLLPSRRSAVMDQQLLTVHDGRRSDAESRSILWERTLNVRAWRFAVKRRTRVPKGWYCMALRLLQDETEIILYTFMSPEEAEAAIGYVNFVRLRPRKETESNNDLGHVAEQRQLLRWEDQRWEDGAEISREDFAAILAKLRQHVPGWF